MNYLILHVDEFVKINYKSNTATFIEEREHYLFCVYTLSRTVLNKYEVLSQINL